MKQKQTTMRAKAEKAKKSGKQKHRKTEFPKRFPVPPDDRNTPIGRWDSVVEIELDPGDADLMRKKYQKQIKSNRLKVYDDKAFFYDTDNSIESDLFREHDGEKYELWRWKWKSDRPVVSD